MPKPNLVLSFVERGWQAAREWSLAEERRGADVIHLIKGRLDAGILALILPAEGVRLVRIPRRWFWLLAWGWVAWGVCSGALRTILVDNDRSLRRVGSWIRGRRIELLRLPEPQAGDSCGSR
jgi:hypothetical protein